MKTTLKALAAVLLLSFTACKDKDKVSVSPQASAQDKIADKDWQVTAMTISPAVETEAGPFSDWYAWMVPDCTKDDYIRFMKDGHVKTDEGLTKCNNEDPQTTTEGTWSISNDGKTFTMNSEGETFSCTVDNLNDSELKMSYKFLEDGTTYTMTTTFRKR